MNLRFTSRLGMLFTFCFLINAIGWSENTPESILNNFDKKTATSSMEEECNLAFTTEQIGVFCNEATGKIRVRISGGTAPFKIEWDNAAGTVWDEATINNRSLTLDHLPPGIYTIKIADEFGCFQEQEVCLKDQVSTMDLVISNNSSACDTEGSIAVSIGNSAPPYWVIVDGPSARGLIINESVFTIDGLLEGDYSITVRKEDCEQTRDITVTNSDALLNLQLEAVKTRSCDGDFGSIATNITGGHPPFRLYFEGTTYGLSNGLTHSDGAKLVQNLTPGVYKFTVIDAEMCTVSKTMRARGPSTPPVKVTTSSTNDPCTRTGTITINPSGGVGPYIISWHGAMFRSTISSRSYTADVPFGTYTVGVEDQEGCKTTTTVIVDSPIPQLKFGATSTRGACGEKGSINVRITSGTAPYQIALNGDSENSNRSNNNFINLAGGTYEIIVTDATGCIEKSTVTLAPESPAVIFVATADAGACGIKGGLSINVSSGTAPYKISLSGAADQSASSQNGTQDFTDLPSGNYTVTVTDAEGCEETNTVSLASEGVAVAFTPTARPGSCGTKGTIDVSISSGNAPYEITWSGAGTGSITVPNESYTIPDLAGGSYTIAVKDGSGCTHSNTVSLAAATPAVQFSATAQPGACGIKGSIALAGISGTAPYTISVSGAATSSATTSASSYALSDLSGGTYAITIRDANGCERTSTLTLAPEGVALNFTASPRPGSCGVRGAIAIAVTNGTAPYEITWTDVSSNSISSQTGKYAITDLPAGTYRITLTDAAGCTHSTTVSLASEGETVAFSATAHPGACGIKGSISGSISSGIAPYFLAYNGDGISDFVEIDGSSFNLPSLGAGTYELLVRDAAGCEHSTSVSLAPEGESVQFTAAAHPGLCGRKGSIEINASSGSGPYTISWTGPENNSLTAPTGAYTFTDATAGTYQVTVRDANGCQHTVVVTLATEGSALQAEVSTQAAYCGGRGFILVNNISGTAPYHVSWYGPVSNSDNTQNSYLNIAELPAGSYEVKIKDANGCQYTQTVSLAGSDPITIASEASIDNCSQTGDIWVTPEGGSGNYTLTWSGPTEGSVKIDKNGYSIEDSPLGHYTITITDENGCTASTSLRVVVLRPFLEYSLTTGSAVNGAKGVISVHFSNGQDPHTISWTGPVSGNSRASGSSYNIDNLPPGAYTITVTDANGCFAVQHINVENIARRDNLVFDTQAKDQVGVRLGSIKVLIRSGEGPYTISWVGPTTGYTRTNETGYTIESLPSGRYSITVTDKNGVYNVGEAVVGFTPVSPLAISVSSSPSICGNDGTVSISISGGYLNYTVNWMGNSNGSVVTGNSSQEISLASGSYVITVIDGEGTRRSAAVNVGVENGTLYCSLQPTSGMCMSNGSLLVIIDGGSPAYQLRWEGPSSGSITVSDDYTITNLPQGTYTTYVVDTKGCSVTESITVGTAPSNLSASIIGESQSILVSFQSGTPNYTISWSGPTTGSKVAAGNTRLNSLPAGLYRVNIEDANGCSLSRLVRVATGFQSATTGRNETSLESGTKTELPAFTTPIQANKMELGQNFPNPFSGATTIPFELSESRKVMISVHDSFGKLLSQHQNTYSAGSNQYELNSSAFESGVYYYTLSTGDKNITKRMILVK